MSKAKPKVKVRTNDAPKFLAVLKKALVDELGAKGIDAKVHTEPVPTTQLHRVMVLAPQFEAMRHSERQSLVWRIAERAISPDDQLAISMILTLTPEDVEGE